MIKEKVTSVNEVGKHLQSELEKLIPLICFEDKLIRYHLNGDFEVLQDGKEIIKTNSIKNAVDKYNLL